MGTGGGEWLAALPHRPPRTVATESWLPNLEVATARLRPLGVTVVFVEAAPDNVDQDPDEQRGRLPFAGCSFALVTNRHESFLASEVARVLAPGGTFLTQQTGGDYGDFFEALGLLRPRILLPHWTVRFAAQQLEAAGLTVVDGDEAVQETSFADVGAFAWYLKAIPWMVEGFSIARYRAQLERPHQRLEAGEPLTVRLPAFWVKAVKYS
jgi:SAM-dependent methyltransferase